MLTDTEPSFGKQLSRINECSRRLSWHHTETMSTVFIPCRLTFRVAEPEGLAHCLRFSANSVTGQGLGERNEVTGAGKPVLYDGRPWVVGWVYYSGNSRKSYGYRPN